jgi:tRNA A-37 threonylcarbamoyl transferase component Bud32
VVIAEETLRIAQVMPDYDIERELGRGGMGIVFLGRHKRLRRGAAIKELPPSFAAEPEVQERFAVEAQTLAGLAHPHIVPIFDYVERDGLCLIVMQELPGGSVWDRFTTTGLTPPTACAVVMACCAALQHAHDKGVLHLDVKPDNLMFDAESAVKVTDFGIARVITGGKTMGTVDGQVLGTPAYMSPEQARGDELTAASDVYAAGVMLYELLSGQLPWQGAETASELLRQRLTEDPIPIRDVNPAIPEPLAAVTMTSLTREVEGRYNTAEDFGVAIGQACAEAWGPGWIDHSGVAIIGSERLSMAARTTGHHPTLDVRPEPVAAPAVLDLTDEARTTGAPQRPGGAAATGAVPRQGPAPAGAKETAARGVAPVVRAAPATGATAPAAPATGAVRPAPATGATPPAAPATGAVPPASAPAARETAARTLTPKAPATEAAPPAGQDVEAETPAGTQAETENDDATSPPAAPPAPPLEFAVVRSADVGPRIKGADLAELELAYLIGVQDVLDPPRNPWRALTLTALLLGGVILVALIGLGAPDRTGALAPGQVELEDVDIASGDRIAIDLSTDVLVRVPDEELAGSADEVEIEFSYLGQAVGTASAPLRDGEALVDPGLTQRTVGGAATAAVRLKSRDTVVVGHETPVDAQQSPYLTAPFVLGALLLLLAYADLETSMKPLRSGHTRVRSYIGAVIWTPVAAVGALMMATALGFAEPTTLAIGTVVVLAALGGAAAVRSRIGVARRRRVRTAVKRAEKRLGVHVAAA